MAIFKVTVRYKDEAHPEQVVNVGGPKIRTAADAEAHCLSTPTNRGLYHVDECGDVFHCVSAVRVRDEPYKPSELPFPNLLQKLVNDPAFTTPPA